MCLIQTGLTWITLERTISTGRALSLEAPLTRRPPAGNLVDSSVEKEQDETLIPVVGRDAGKVVCPGKLFL